MLGYTVVRDCGTVLNPVVVEGQIHGGVAQGIAGGLYEHLVYDEGGQPRAATYVDYLIPTGDEIPPIEVEHLESPAPALPLGAKGMGESGAIGGAAAIANAVCDALAEFRADVRETPLTPERVLGLIRTGD